MPRSKPSKVDGFSGDDEAQSDDMSINDDDSASAESDDEDMVVVQQDALLWSTEELSILAGLKDKWFNSTGDERDNVTDEATLKLLKLDGKRDINLLKPKVAKWLKRNSGKRRGFGPTKFPTLHQVFTYYNQVELIARVKEVHGVNPEHKSFLGFWKHEAGEMLRELRSEDSKEELMEYEAKRRQWALQGLPGNKKRE
jgi:hypothetical protein